MEGTNVLRWNLNGNGKFSVESMYKALIELNVSVDNP
jgi:hypothetical protein